MKRPPSPLANQDPEPPSVPYSHDMKTVEFEVDGKLTRLSVYDPIEILSKVCPRCLVCGSLGEWTLARFLFVWFLYRALDHTNLLYFPVILNQ